MSSRGDGGADGERARVVEGAVAQVLHEVRDVDERRDADPLRALAAHLRHRAHPPVALAGEHRPSCDSRCRRRRSRRPPRGCSMLCGQPEQKNGVRCAPSAAGVRAATASRRSSTRGRPAFSRTSRRAPITRVIASTSSAPCIGTSGAPRSSRTPSTGGSRDRRRARRGRGAPGTAPSPRSRRSPRGRRRIRARPAGPAGSACRSPADARGAAEVGDRAQGVVDRRARGDDPDARGGVVVDDRG